MKVTIIYIFGFTTLLFAGSALAKNSPLPKIETKTISATHLCKLYGSGIIPSCNKSTEEGTKGSFENMTLTCKIRCNGVGMLNFSLIIQNK